MHKYAIICRKYSFLSGNSEKITYIYKKDEKILKKVLTNVIIGYIILS